MVGRCLIALLLAATPVAAQEALPDWLAIHGQATLVAQATPGFRSPYAGPNSLTPIRSRRRSTRRSTPGCAHGAAASCG